MPRDARPGKPAARLLGAALGLALLAALLADHARGQLSPAAAPPAELAAPGLDDGAPAPRDAAPVQAIPDCGGVVVAAKVSTCSAAPGGAED